MRTPRKRVAEDGTVTWRVRWRKDGLQTSTTFRGPTAEADAREFAEFLWVAGGAELARAKREIVVTRGSRSPSRRISIDAAPSVEAVARRGGMTAAPSHLPKRERDRLDRALGRAKATGRVTIWTADEIATIILRRHPVELYGNAWPS